ncbi:response regulator [bacterium]|nr:response regulator [bacterium]
MDESRQIQWFRRELAETSQRFEEKIRELFAIRRIWDSLKYTRDTHRVFESVLNIIMDEANAERCALLLLNRETGKLTFKTARGDTEGSVQFGQKLEEGLAEVVAQRRKPVLIPDIVAFHPAGPAGSLLCLPLLVEDQVVGVLNLSHSAPGAFNSEDEQFMAVIADQVAGALNSVQIFDEMQQFNVLLEAEVKKATEELSRANLELNNEVAERRRAEEALRQREAELEQLNASLEERVRQRTLELQALYERMEGLVEHLPEGVFLLDQGGRLILANPPAQEALKDLAEAGVGDPVSRIGGRALEEILTPRPDGLAHEVAVEGLTQRIFEVKARPISEGGWVLVMREVTQEREMQERAQQQDRLAAVGQLAAGVAHDFNNLLTGIIGFAELLELRGDIPEPAKESLRIIISQGQRAAQLVRQILDFTRKTLVEREPVNLALFLKEAVRALQRTLPEGIRLAPAFEAEDLVVQASLSQLRQALLNLVSNARDAMPEGGEVRIGLSRAEVQPGAPPPLPGVKPGDWAVWTVSDTGTGMSPEVMAHIYEPFFTTKGTGRGSGLGLSQVYGIVQQHNGEIGVESEVGEGTSFTIYLPQAMGADASPQRPGEIQVGRGETILVVEDEAEVLQVVRDLLERLSYRVLTASDGPEALRVYEAHRGEIALVLTDMVMPEMSGLDLFEALKGRDPDVRVAVMTGYPGNRGEKVQLPEGVAGHLEKPMRVSQLARVVSEALKRGRDR